MVIQNVGTTRAVRYEEVGRLTVLFELKLVPEIGIGAAALLVKRGVKIEYQPFYTLTGPKF